MSLDHSLCGFSTGICGGVTAGQGELDANGYWETPCPECAGNFDAGINVPRVVLERWVATMRFSPIGVKEEMREYLAKT